MRRESGLTGCVPNCEGFEGRRGCRRQKRHIRQSSPSLTQATLGWVPMTFEMRRLVVKTLTAGIAETDRDEIEFKE